MRILAVFAMMALTVLAPVAWAAGPSGPLIIAGGDLSADNPTWQRMVDLAGGAGARLLVIPTASGEPLKSGQRAVDRFNRLGAQAELVPLVVDDRNIPTSNLVEDPAWIEQARAARGFWFIGGDQGRITAALLRPDGSDTPLLAALRQAHAKGAVVGGSSAGAAIMSRIMFKEGPEPLEALRGPLTIGRHTDRGLGFIGEDWFVDQHFLARGRVGRAVVAMREHRYAHGIGVEEDSAIQIADGRSAEVIGSRGVVLIDLSQASASNGFPFRMDGARLSFLGPGDRFDLETRQVTPSPRKAQGAAIVPSSPDFKPYYNAADGYWFADMLGPGILYDAMARVLEGRAGRAEGIAFGRPNTSASDETGFVFTLTRDARTRGWFASEPAAYTILDVVLAISPVRMAKPLYQPLRN